MHAQSILIPSFLAPLWFIKEGVCSFSYFPTFIAEFKFILFKLEFLPLFPPPFMHPFLSWPRHFLFLSFFFTPSYTSDIWPLPSCILNCGSIIAHPFWESPIKDWQGKWMKGALSWAKINWSGQWDRTPPSFASIHEQSHRSPLDVSLRRVKWLLYS